MKYLKYLLGVLLVVVPAAVTVLVYNDKITQNAPVYYRQGVHYYNKGNWEASGYLLDSGNFTNWVTPTSIGAAPASHNHSGTYATTGDLNTTNTNLSTLNGTVASINTTVSNLSSSQGKVTQKNTTASDYRALVLGTTHNSDPANLTTEVMGEAYVSSAIYAKASNGSLYATTFHGSGANLTNLNAGNITSGTLNIARMPAGLMKITSWNSSTGELQLSTT